jgi:hypothetical protein
VASAPEPFLRLPLTYDRAFGGRAWGEDFETASGDNPHGKGFVLKSDRIEGTALPNIEEQDQLLTDPMQRPLPAGLAPLPRQSTIRLARGAIPDFSRFFLVARRALVYQLSPRRRRTITLRDGLPSAPSTAQTLGQALADAQSGPSLLPHDTEPLIPFELLRALKPLTDILESLPFCPSD